VSVKHFECGQSRKGLPAFALFWSFVSVKQTSLSVPPFFVAIFQMLLSMFLLTVALWMDILFLRLKRP
ncbi:hypothetical protein, partial [Trichlorobacter lovleyi]|uniref:hypothetical protein n=1 Tax=Trichlorobacter lovleyi TaxID=313985 RepID=UPI0024814A42